MLTAQQLFQESSAFFEVDKCIEYNPKTPTISINGRFSFSDDVKAHSYPFYLESNYRNFKESSTLYRSIPSHACSDVVLMRPSDLPMPIPPACSSNIFQASHVQTPLIKVQPKLPDNTWFNCH
jgi:hypothetical protein